MKGLFIPEMTVEKFRNKCFESIETLMTEDEIFNIDYDPRYIPAIRDKLWEIQQCSNCILKPEKQIAEIKPRWIPVTERLPDNSKGVLVTRKTFIGNHRVIDIAYYLEITNTWVAGNSYTITVEAWMPVPEPWEETEERKAYCE